MPDHSLFSAKDLEKLQARRQAAREKHGNNGFGLTLGQLVALEVSPWTTPQAHDTHPRGAGNRENPKAGNACLAWDAKQTAPWATPANRDYRYPNAKSYQERSNTTKGEQLNNQVVHGINSPSYPAETTNPAASVLNPAMSRWLMGFRSTHDTLSPGWSSWVLMQKLLSGSSPRREEIELAVSEVTAMQFVRK
jgi:hypothetical protein